MARHCAKCNGSVEKIQTRQKERNSPSAFLASMVPEQSLQRCVEFSDGQWRKVLSEQMPGGFVE